MADKIMQKEIISEPFSSMVTNEEISDTLQDFVSLQQVYEAGIKEIRTKLEILDDEFKVKHDHNPIHHMEYRLKSVKSILGKLEKRGLEVSLESITLNLTDIAGVRVVCNYVSDVYKIADLLIKQSDVKLLKKKII